MNELKNYSSNSLIEELIIRGARKKEITLKFLQII